MRKHLSAASSIYRLGETGRRDGGRDADSKSLAVTRELQKGSRELWPSAGTPWPQDSCSCVSLQLPCDCEAPPDKGTIGQCANSVCCMRSVCYMCVLYVCAICVWALPNVQRSTEASKRRLSERARRETSALSWLFCWSCLISASSCAIS